MSTVLSSPEEQAQLREAVRSFLADNSSSEDVRRLMETAEGHDPAVWASMAEMGLQGLIVPEELGGSGLGWFDQAIVFEEMGRSLICAPYFATVALAASALLQTDDNDAKREYLPSIAAGDTVATVAFTEDGGNWSLESRSTRAREAGDGWVLDGHKSFVIDGCTADLIFVAALTDAADGQGPDLTLFAVVADAPGLTRTPLPAMDTTRKLARLEFAGTPARLVGAAGSADAVLRRTLDIAAVALAAEQVGGAARCLEMTTDYAKTRVQFARRIGSFQAVKHRCTNMLVDLEAGRAAAFYAASAVDGDDLAAAASLAQAVCSEMYFRIACDAIQIHGGIGFTWEHDCHLFFKRAKSSELLLGDAVYHRERLARAIGVAPDTA